jgi:hypothetical protein
MNLYAPYVLASVHDERCGCSSVIAAGGVDLRRAPRTRTRPCSWHWYWSKLACLYLLYQSITVGRIPAAARQDRQLGTGRWAARSDDGRAGPGYPVGRYESGHIEPAARRLNSNAQPWIVFGGGWDGRQRQVTSDAMTDRRHPDGKVAMALEGPDLRSGAYAWIAARQAATMAEPHSLTHDAQTRLHLAPRRRLNSCHQYPASAANSARHGNSVSPQTTTAS